MRKILILLFIPLPLFAPIFKEEFFNTRGVSKKIVEIERKREEERILRAIRMVESSGRYDAVGLSGEHGAYQFLLSTFKQYSIMFYGEEIDIKIPHHQDMVARAKIRWLLDKGWKPDNIASFWNSGSPYWRGKVGINKYGVRYNVPLYVTKFKRYYEAENNSSR